MPQKKTNLCIDNKTLLSQLIGPWEIWMKFEVSSFQANLSDLWLRYLMWNCPQMNITSTVLWIRGRPVAKCDSLLGRANQHDPRSRPMGDPALDKWEHD